MNKNKLWQITMLNEGQVALLIKKLCQIFTKIGQTLVKV